MKTIGSLWNRGEREGLLAKLPSPSSLALETGEGKGSPAAAVSRRPGARGGPGVGERGEEGGRARFPAVAQTGVARGGLAAGRTAASGGGHGGATARLEGGQGDGWE